jgi:hypothetical protein
VLLKGDIDALNRVGAQESQQAAQANYEYLLSKAHLLESEGKTTEAKKAYQDAANAKPLELPQPSNQEDHPSPSLEYGVSGGIALVCFDYIARALWGGEETARQLEPPRLPWRHRSMRITSVEGGEPECRSADP